MVSGNPHCGNLIYRRSTGFRPLSILWSKIKNIRRRKYCNFSTLKFVSKILLSIAPIARIGVQSEVVLFLKKAWGPKSYAKHRTSAPCNFYTINFLLFLAYDDLSRYNCEIGPLISFKKMFYNYYQKIKTKLLEIVQLSHETVFISLFIYL